MGGGTPLSNVAAELGLEARNAGPVSRIDFVPGVGRQNAAIGAAFGLQPGEVSGVVTTASNAYVLEVLTRTDTGLPRPLPNRSWVPAARWSKAWRTIGR